MIFCHLFSAVTYCLPSLQCSHVLSAISSVQSRTVYHLFSAVTYCLLSLQLPSELRNHFDSGLAVHLTTLTAPDESWCYLTVADGHGFVHISIRGIENKRRRGSVQHLLGKLCNADVVKANSNKEQSTLRKR